MIFQLRFPACDCWEFGTLSLFLVARPKKSAPLPILTLLVESMRGVRFVDFVLPWQSPSSGRLTRTAVCEASEKRGGCDEVDSRGCYSVCRKCLSSRSEKRLVPDFFLTWSSAPRKQVHVWQVCHVASLCAAKSSSYPTVELPYFSIKISSYTTRWENFCPSYAESPVKWAPLIEVLLYNSIFHGLPSSKILFWQRFSNIHRNIIWGFFYGITWLLMIAQNGLQIVRI